MKSSEKSGERRDFITLNKAATQAGLVTAQEHFQYRATHSNGNKRGDSRQKTGGLDSTKLPLLSDRVFGLPTKWVVFAFIFMSWEFKFKNSNSF